MVPLYVASLLVATWIRATEICELALFGPALSAATPETPRRGCITGDFP